jgi:hypothetical protein
MSTDQKAPNGQGGHERRDVTFRPLVIAAALLVIALLVAVVGMERLFDYLAAREASRSEPASPLAASRRDAPPEPRLQTEPLEDLQALREREQSALDGYGWVDREQGIVRIPIERALELTLERAPKTPALRDGVERQ